MKFTFPFVEKSKRKIRRCLATKRLQRLQNSGKYVYSPLIQIQATSAQREGAKANLLVKVLSVTMPSAAGLGPPHRHQTPLPTEVASRVRHRPALQPRRTGDCHSMESAFCLRMTWMSLLIFHSFHFQVGGDKIAWWSLAEMAKRKSSTVKQVSSKFCVDTKSTKVASFLQVPPSLTPSPTGSLARARRRSVPNLFRPRDRKTSIEHTDPDIASIGTVSEGETIFLSAIYGVQ